MSAVIFFIAAIGAIAGAFGVVMVRNPFYCVLALVGHLVCLAALFLLLGAQFVAAAQVIVYAGAVMVLYVFVVAYIGEKDEPLHRPGGLLRVLSPLFGFALAVELCIAVLGTALAGINTKGTHLTAGYGSPEQIGQSFLTRYLLAFELASLLLLVAAVGAVVLARRRRGLDDAVDEPLRVIRRPAFTGTMAESGGLPVGHIPEASEVTIELPAGVGASAGSSGDRGTQAGEPEGGAS